jgi:peptidylprolyl isomerase/FKBP-type peptidyl-prolyl cis-trans isomerase FklB
MIANMGAIDKIKANPEYKELRSPGNEGSIYYKVINAGTGKDSIHYTSIISCYYKGWFISEYPEYNIKADQNFDKRLFDDGPPSVFSISSDGLIRGWKTALQNMVRGDKWEIWVPYQLGYGRDDHKGGALTIPGYSTLVFELEVLNIRGIDDL